MRRIPRSIALAVVAAAACSSSDEQLSFGSVAGTWELAEFLYIDVADGSNTFDFVPVLARSGIVLRLELRADGTAIFSQSGTPVDTTLATLQGGVIDLNTGGDQDVWRVTLSGATMTWDSEFTELFDIDNDGTDETARIRARWTRP